MFFEVFLNEYTWVVILFIWIYIYIHIIFETCLHKVITTRCSRHMHGSYFACKDFSHAEFGFDTPEAQRYQIYSFLKIAIFDFIYMLLFQCQIVIYLVVLLIVLLTTICSFPPKCLNRLSVILRWPGRQPLPPARFSNWNFCRAECPINLRGNWSKSG